MLRNAYNGLRKDEENGLAATNAANPLFPVFLKLENMEVLLVGAGKVGLEKLSALLRNAPATKVTIVAREIAPALRELAAAFPRILLLEKDFAEEDLDGKDLVITALNDSSASGYIRECARERGLLVNAADKPELCDFYLGSIVQKGPVKIAISTNGQSPTMARRLKEMLNEVLPEEIGEATHNLHLIRQSLKGNFEEKVKQLNEITRDFSARKARSTQQKTYRLAGKLLWPLLFMSIGFLLSYLLR